MPADSWPCASPSVSANKSQVPGLGDYVDHNLMREQGNSLDIVPHLWALALVDTG
jgi:hypothetical protein